MSAGINWFSVKQAIRIGNERCVPCICYEITSENRKAIMMLARENKVHLYMHKVYFQNGKAIERKVNTPVAKPVESKKSKLIVKKETKA